ncbi:CLUMA_CG010570, isoform A [Clunio marinus]|uniref:CLUMA_CG010570, isoform A n=1 Tax=Clunio marinus TaxID=568069 RepID=A0A1J1IA63_9DIPT|nr:CLUMA_CG010570, isoform A [Clunio marinus]
MQSLNIYPSFQIFSVAHNSEKFSKPSKPYLMVVKLKISFLKPFNLIPKLSLQIILVDIQMTIEHFESYLGSIGFRFGIISEDLCIQMTL